MRYALLLGALMLVAGCVGLPARRSAAHGACPCCESYGRDPATLAARELHRRDDLQELIRLAERDNAEAQYLLAIRHDRGGAEAAGGGEAMRWLRRAAFLEHPAAQFTMARSYAQGHGVERDERQAARWYAVAAERGFGPAMFALAECYNEGRGVDRDPQQARAWLEKLARRSRCLLRREARQALVQIVD